MNEQTAPTKSEDFAAWFQNSEEFKKIQDELKTVITIHFILSPHTASP